MSSRREFVQMGAFTIGAIAAGRHAVAATEPPSCAAADPLYVVLYDERFPECAAFAADASSRGRRTRGFDQGDVTRVWYDDLYHRWKEGPAAIAGLTAPGALFVLETLGNDAGLRLQFKAEHRLFGDRVEHRLLGPDVMLRAALPLEVSGSGWSSHMGHVICGSRPAIWPRVHARLTTPLTAGPRSEQNLLVSWVLTRPTGNCP